MQFRACRTVVRTEKRENRDADGPADSRQSARSAKANARYIRHIPYPAPTRDSRAPRDSQSTQSHTAPHPSPPIEDRTHTAPPRRTPHTTRIHDTGHTQSEAGRHSESDAHRPRAPCDTRSLKTLGAERPDAWKDGTIDEPGSSGAQPGTSRLAPAGPAQPPIHPQSVQSCACPSQRAAAARHQTHQGRPLSAHWPTPRSSAIARRRAPFA